MNAPTVTPAPSDVACCRSCGSTYVEFIKCVLEWKQPYNFGFYVACFDCFAVTPTRENPRDCEQDVIWRKPEEIRQR